MNKLYFLLLIICVGCGVDTGNISGSKSDIDIVIMDFNPITISVYYSRRDYRQWSWSDPKVGFPAYLPFPYTEIKVTYLIPSDMAQILAEHEWIKLKAKIYYRDKELMQHTLNFDRHSAFLYHSENSEHLTTTAKYIKLSLVDRFTGKYIASCTTAVIPKYKCNHDSWFPSAYMCDYYNAGLNCPIKNFF